MTAYNGWTCQGCGAFVPDGCTHHCPTTVVPAFNAGRPPTTAITFTEKGWECPRCHSTYAPWVWKCDHCFAPAKERTP